MEKRELKGRNSRRNKSKLRRKLHLDKDPFRTLNQNPDRLSFNNFTRTFSTTLRQQQTVLSSIPLRALPLLPLLLDDLRLAQQLD